LKLLFVALSALSLACASAAPEAPEPASPAKAETAELGLKAYEGSYAMQAPNRLITLRAWVDAEGKLNGELIGTGNQTTFRPSGEEHKFLHATADDIWVVFTVENGRAVSATMHQRGREISGPRTQ
jgi:hypothetical protein